MPSVFSSILVRGRSVLKMNAAAETATGGVPDGTLRLYNDTMNSYQQVYSLDVGGWDSFSPDAVLAATYAPIGVDYLVGTASGTLTGEIVAGTAPGGELGGTWASPTVDTTHAGSAHHAEAHTVPSHTGTPGGELGGTWTSPTVDTTHSGSAHHSESHNVASHSDTSATGAQLNTLVGGGSTTLHSHVGLNIDAVTSDVTYSANTTLSTILSFTGAANADYAVWGCLMVTESNPGGELKLQFSVPSGAVAYGNASSDVNETDAFSSAAVGVVALTDGTISAVMFSAVVDMAGTGGTVALQTAQNDATGSLIIEKGSWLAYQAL